MAERAVAMAREAPEDPWCGLADAGGAGARLGRRRARPRRPRADARRPRRCRRRRSRPRRRRWRCPASARWTRPAPAGRRAGSTSPPRNGFSGGYARTGHSVQAVAICGEGTAMERDYAFESRVHRADLPDPAEVGRLAGERAGGAGRRRQAADRRLSGGLRRARRLRADRPPGAGDQRHRDRPRRELAQGRDGRAGAAGRHRPRRGPAPAADRRLAAVRRRGPAGRAAGCWSRTACCGAGRSTSPPAASSGCRAPATPAAAPRRRRRPSAGNLALTQGAASRDELLAEMGTGLARHLADRRLDQPDDRRLFARRQRLLGRERRDRPAGQRVHDRRQPARDAARRSARPTTPGRWLGRVVPSLLVEGLVIAGS